MPRLWWQKARPTDTDRALMTNGAYKPPERFDLVDDSGTIHATVQRRGGAYAATAAGSPIGQFRTPADAKAAARRHVDARKTTIHASTQIGNPDAPRVIIIADHDT